MYVTKFRLNDKVKITVPRVECNKEIGTVVSCCAVITIGNNDGIKIENPLYLIEFDNKEIPDMWFTEGTIEAIKDDTKKGHNL